MKKLFLALFFFSSTLTAIFAVSVRVTDFGARPDSREDASEAVRLALKACEGKRNVTLVFPKGRYDFYPDKAIERVYFETNTTDNNPKNLAILIENREGLTIDGDGSLFVMHGSMQPLTVENSSGITLKNFSIDWDFPLTGQGRVTAVTDNYFDVEIDSVQYPYLVENRTLFFIPEGRKEPLEAIMQYQPDTRLIEPYTGDYGCTPYPTGVLGGGRVRMYRTRETEVFPKQGNILILRHSERDHAGIFLLNSRNLRLHDLVIYHTAGLGILGQYSSDIEFKRVSVIPNRAKGRYFSGHDDGFHLMGCSGSVQIEQCEWEGLMDDPVNIHGTSVRIIHKTGANSLLCRFMHIRSAGMEWGRPGELVGFIDNESMHTVATRTVKSVRPLSKTDFEIEFTDALPEEIKEGYALENLTCVPDVEIRNSRFLSCRARGLLVSTPGKVLVENNIFESSGSAILIAGDANGWYESGAVRDVTIRRNEFRDPCLTSMYQFCEAVISICPEIPKPDFMKPYHGRIHIEENRFEMFDYPLIYAKSVRELSFTKNTVVRSYRFKPFHHQKDAFTLEYCNRVFMKRNRVQGDVLGKTVRSRNMPGDALILDPKEPFVPAR